MSFPLKHIIINPVSFVCTEEHIVYTKEPGGEYLFHFTPPEATTKDKPAKQTAKVIVGWVNDHDVDKTLDSIGGDSTNSNTGWLGGTFTHTETLLGRKKTWLA